MIWYGYGNRIFLDSSATTSNLVVSFSCSDAIGWPHRKDAKSPRLGFKTSWFPICLLSKIRNGFKICHVEFPQNYNWLYLKWRNAGDISISSRIYRVPKSSKIFPVPRCFDPLKAFTGSAWGSKTFTRLHSQDLTRCLESQRVEMTGLEMFISHPFVACLIMAMLLCFPSHNNMYSQTKLHRKLHVKEHVEKNSETTNPLFAHLPPALLVFTNLFPTKRISQDQMDQPPVRTSTRQRDDTWRFGRESVAIITNNDLHLK